MGKVSKERKPSLAKCSKVSSKKKTLKADSEALEQIFAKKEVKAKSPLEILREPPLNGGKKSGQQQTKATIVNDAFFDSRGEFSRKKYTEEGYQIYSLTDLKVGEGKGDTPECPFDCKCCF